MRWKNVHGTLLNETASFPIMQSLCYHKKESEDLHICLAQILEPNINSDYSWVYNYRSLSILILWLLFFKNFLLQALIYYNENHFLSRNILVICIRKGVLVIF